jgi:hypothetical protein
MRHTHGGPGGPPPLWPPPPRRRTRWVWEVFCGHENMERYGKIQKINEILDDFRLYMYIYIIRWL